MAAGDEDARLGAHVGEFYVGDIADPSFTCYIGGTNRTSAFGDIDDIHIHYGLGEPGTMTVSGIRGFTPTRGQEILLYHGGNSVGFCVFAGHILEVSQTQERLADKARFSLRCQDYTWLLDRYARVTKTYYSKGINTILADILANFTNGGFVPGYCASGLGSIDAMQFTGEQVSAACTRLARAGDAFFAVTPDKHVHIFADPDHLSANTISVTDASKTFEHYRNTLDLTTVRTRVTYKGRATTASSVAEAGATTVSVDECNVFVSSGGSAISGSEVFTYTGLSALSGPGTLTGVTGLDADIGQGDEVAVYYQADDSTAQTNLATILGGGLSGIATHYVADGRLSDPECRARATADLARYSGALQSITYDTRDRFHSSAFWTWPGKIATVNVTTPVAASGDFRVQSMDLSVDGSLSGNQSTWRRKVTLGALNRQLELVDRLALVGGAT